MKRDLKRQEGQRETEAAAAGGPWGSKELEFNPTFGGVAQRFGGRN